jgi:hypothetical protein
MKLKASLNYDQRFEGLDAKLFIDMGILTVLFNGGKTEWAAFSFRIGDEKADLQFYQGPKVVNTEKGVNLDEAIAIVRATKAKEAA